MLCINVLYHTHASKNREDMHQEAKSRKAGKHHFVAKVYIYIIEGVARLSIVSTNTLGGKKMPRTGFEPAHSDE